MRRRAGRGGECAAHLRRVDVNNTYGAAEMGQWGPIVLAPSIASGTLGGIRDVPPSNLGGFTSQSDLGGCRTDHCEPPNRGRRSSTHVSWIQCNDGEPPWGRPLRTELRVRLHSEEIGRLRRLPLIAEVGGREKSAGRTALHRSAQLRPPARGRSWPKAARHLHGAGGQLIGMHG